MTYSTLSELPLHLRTELPEDAQEIYRAAYNQAYEKGRASQDYSDEAAVAETADQAAWRKVLENYQKDEQGHWRRDPIGEDIEPTKTRNTA